MPAHLISKIAAVLFFATFLAAPRLAAEAPRSTASGAQTANSASSAAKPTPKKVTAKTRVVRKRKPRPRVQTVPTAARISEIQSALAAQGEYKAQPNGKWDSATIQGMKDFQSSHGLTVTGKLDALTLQKLGLGSEIAGRAAPLPLPQTPAGNPSTGPSAAQQQTP